MKSHTLPVKNETDIFVLLGSIKKYLQNENFKIEEISSIVTCTSELAHNIYKYAGEGFISWKLHGDTSDCKIKITAIDNGPGIQDVTLALQEKYSTKGTLGLGLPAIKRLSDEFEIHSKAGKGTKIEISINKRQ